jgi:hypothetical protein
MIARYFSLFVLTALLSLPLAAQQGGVTLTVRMLAFSPECEKSSVYLHDPTVPAQVPGGPPPPQGVKAEIKSYLNHETVTVIARAQRLVITDSPDPASMSKPADVLCAITIPEHVHTGIVMVFSAAKGANPPMNSIMIDDSTKTFPRGSYLVINRSPLPVALQLETKTYGFKPLDFQVIKDPPVGPNHQSAMQAFSFTNGTREQIGSGSWPKPGKTRTLEIFFRNPITNIVEGRGFLDTSARDDPPPGSAKPAPAAPAKPAAQKS